MTARSYVFALGPLVGMVGLLELVAHLHQVGSVVKDASWLEARDVVRAERAPGDLVIFAPRWSDPLGRRFFGEELAPLVDEARADESTYPRAIEVSMRGAHAPEVAGWRKEGERRVGPFTITTLANPAPVTPKDRLLDHDGPDAMQVAEVDGDVERPCTWQRTGAQSGGLGFGATIPADRFVCPRTFVGISVLTPIDFHPRRCFYAPPVAGGSGGRGTLRLRFSNVAFGQILHGHHALDVHAERDKLGAPVTMEVRAGDRVLGRVVHRDGEGWKPFDLPTAELDGTRGELTIDISSPGSNRKYCFEADTR